VRELLNQWAHLEPERVKCSWDGCLGVAYGDGGLVLQDRPGTYGSPEFHKFATIYVQAAVQEAIEARQTWAYHVDNIFRPSSGDSPCVMGFSAGVWATEDGILHDDPPFFEAHGDSPAEALLRAYLQALENTSPDRLQTPKEGEQ
jgi:hypothetical protein